MNTHQLYRWIVIRAGIVLIVLTILNGGGIWGQLYSAFWWLDIVTHTLGGVVVGFLAYAGIIRIRGSQKVDTVFIISWLLSVFSVAIAWELYEFVINIVLPTYPFNRVDTLVDIICDSVGAWVAFQWVAYFGSQFHNEQ